MLHNISESVAIDILDTVVDNGRVLADGDLLDRDSLKAEVEFEAGERGIDSDVALEELVSFALAHSETN